MTGKGHAHERQAETASDFHVDDGQGDGNAALAVQHLVQVAVARVVVIFHVAGEALLHEQELVEGYQGIFEPGLRRQALLHAGGELINLAQVGLDVQAGVFLDRDEQRRFRQVQLLFGDSGDSGETFVHA